MWLYRRRRNSGSLGEADLAAEQAGRGAEQAAETRRSAEAKLAAERRFFARRLTSRDGPDEIAAAIEASLKGGRT
jgi:hypothetical protein